jgi:preprotein translocase subunit SecG
MFEYLFRWDSLWWLLLILYVPSCIGLIVIVLLQKGKGTSFAGAFGVGAGSETVFGPRARKSLPVRITYVMAAIFMLFSLSMSLIGGRIARGNAPEQVEETAKANAATNPEGTEYQGLDSLGLGGTEPHAAAPAEGATPPAPPSESQAQPASQPAAPEPAPATPPAGTPSGQ